MRVDNFFIICLVVIVLLVCTVELTKTESEQDIQLRKEYIELNEDITSQFGRYNKDYKRPSDTSDFIELKLEFKRDEDHYEQMIRNFVSNAGGVLKEIKNYTTFKGKLIPEGINWTSYTILLPNDTRMTDPRALENMLREYYIYMNN